MSSATDGRSAVRGDTRQRILDSALHLFAERGYAGTSIRDIAEELGVTKAAVHYHFPSKEQIVAALLEPYLARFRGVIEGLEDGARPAPVDRVLGGVAEILTDAGPLLGVLTTDPSVAAACGDLHTEGAALGERMAMVLVPEGSGRPDLLRAHACLGGFFAGFERAARDGAVPQEDVDVLLAAAEAALGR